VATSEIQVAERRFRQALIARDAAAARRMVESYAQVHQRAQRDLDAIVARIAARRAEGLEFSPSWLYRQERYQILRRESLREIQRFNAIAEVEIRGLQSSALRDALEAAQELTSRQLRQGGPPGGAARIMSTFAAPDLEALESQIGFLGDGSPLRRVLLRHGAATVDSAGVELVAGLVRGLGPREVAQALTRTLGTGLSKSLLIARTEMMRSHRQASDASFGANADVLDGWRWSAALSDRTCSACLALDGQVFPIGTVFGSHPACRCTMIPIPKSWRDLGFSDAPDARSPLPTGADWLAAQPESVQHRILGARGLEAYQSGEMNLRDFVGYRKTRAWGETRYARSVTAFQAGRRVPPRGSWGVPESAFLGEA